MLSSCKHPSSYSADTKFELGFCPVPLLAFPSPTAETCCSCSGHAHRTALTPPLCSSPLWIEPRGVEAPRCARAWVACPMLAQAARVRFRAWPDKHQHPAHRAYETAAADGAATFCSAAGTHRRYVT